MAKLLIEILFSLFVLVLLFPLILIISISIWISMSWPIFFIQERVGLNGSLFKLYKFRTMVISGSSTSGSFEAGVSSRITPIGKLLRKTKLDEIPQLINVLKGDMSIVGPRPEVKQWTEIYPKKWKIVHSVKPGISDNASIEFRNEEEILARSDDPLKTYRDVILPRKLELYIDYVNNRSLCGDLKIIYKTIKVVIFE